MSILANSNSVSNSRSTSNKSPNSKGSHDSNSKGSQIKKGGISVKRKLTPVPLASTPPSKKINSSSSSSKRSAIKPASSFSSSSASSFDLEATLCPICDEACTCPKTASPSALVAIKSPLKTKKKTKDVAAGSVTTNTKKNRNKKVSSSSSSSSAPLKKKSTGTSRNKKQFLSDSEAFYTDEDEEDDFETTSSFEGNVNQPLQRRGTIEDPALSFIRMIYSDEESLDEEEAYALYQATQLFSSSSEEEEEAGYSSDDSEGYGSEYTDNESSVDEGFEYTVVEYVQPTRKSAKKTTEFIAYDSGNDSETETNDENGNEINLLINSTHKDVDSDTDASSTASAHSNSNSNSQSDSDSENWMTYSVFDVDRDLALNQLTGFTSGSTSLSCQGSGTPDTLLFSTSSSDKIPNIAPQVLAAISAAAKHMAANQRTSENCTGGNGSTSTSKYFSYITLKDPSRPALDTLTNDANEEEFLFFEEDAFEVDAEVDEEDIESIGSASPCNSEDVDISADDFEESFSDCSSQDMTTTKTKVVARIASNTAPTIQQKPNASTSSSAYNNFTLNRWNRVPIGAFRRSRRPSIPSYHHIHPSNALKSFSTDPANFTLVTPTTGEDSFDESTTTTTIGSITAPERSQSVITWDELDLDIVNPNNNTTTSTSHHPIPKRSRSVAPAVTSSNSLANNFEWLNSNWNWEI